jgi:rod shape-determining protein MreD
MIMKLAGSFFLFLVLTIMPLPVVIHSLKPSWVILLVLYVQFFLPRYFNIFMVFALGLIVDVLSFSLLGEHALIMIIICLLAKQQEKRLQFASLSKQVFFIAVLCFIYEDLIYVSNIAQRYQINSFWPIISTCASVILWPWVKAYGDRILKTYDKR